MKQIYSIISIIFFLMINNGCASNSNRLPESIFNNIKTFEKPKEISSFYEMYEEYIKLYNVYNNNKIILDSIQNINK